MKKIIVSLWMSMLMMLPVIGSSDFDVEKVYMQAKQGDAQAQFDLGQCMYQVVKDYKVAAQWFTKAAEQGHVESQAMLGICYSTGEGVPQDFGEAAKWYRKAAEQGLDIMQVRLGNCYADGIGVPQDNKEAASWFRKAAEQGNALAQNNLARSYAAGLGVLEDYVEAYAWFLVASMNGDVNSSGNKEIVKSLLSDDQVAAGQQRAKELQALIERKKVITESKSSQSLPSDIAPSGFGSGLLVKGGYVLTCWHVVDGAERISISFKGKDHVASVVQKDAANDIAILKVNDFSGGTALNLSDDVQLGESVFTLGYPHPDLQGSDIKFTTGSISSLTGIDNSPRYFQISAPLQAGNSGGPLFDEKGNLVGIVAAKLDSLATLELTGDLPQNVNYAIKADYLVPVLKTVQGLEVGKEKAENVNLLELIDELKQSVVMIKVY